MATYNEEVLAYVLDRYRALARVKNVMVRLVQGKQTGKYTDHHTNAVVAHVTGVLGEYFEDDENLPELTGWDGENKPQCIFRAEGGHDALPTIIANNGIIALVTMTRNKGQGYARPPIIKITTDTGSGAELTPVLNDEGGVESVTVVNGGSEYPQVVTNEVSPAPPEIAASTDDQLVDDDYIPAGWSRSAPAVNSTDRRTVYCSERTGYAGNWSEWNDPRVWAQYSD